MYWLKKARDSKSGETKLVLPEMTGKQEDEITRAILRSIAEENNVTVDEVDLGAWYIQDKTLRVRYDYRLTIE